MLKKDLFFKENKLNSNKFNKNLKKTKRAFQILNLIFKMIKFHFYKVLKKIIFQIFLL